MNRDAIIKLLERRFLGDGDGDKLSQEEFQLKLAKLLLPTLQPRSFKSFAEMSIPCGDRDE